MVKFKVDYVVKLPKLGHSPKVSISGDPENKDIYQVLFIDKTNKKLIFNGECQVNQTIVGARQWHTDWLINIFDSNNKLVFIDNYDPTNQKVYIKIDAYALGDNIAWMPYVELYRKKYNCVMICSTFHNHLFAAQYPEILFVEPNSVIENLYSQFYIGATNELDLRYTPVDAISVPLQRVASETLGLDYSEVKPSVNYLDLPLNDHGGKYVCISEFGSAPAKSWRYEGGWQFIVDYLNSIGYKVVVISKEPTELMNVINKTGDIPLSDRITDLHGADFYMGVSSGLAWLSWGVGTHVVMISDVTPHWHEFQSNMTRICVDYNLEKVDYSSSLVTHPDYVIEKIKEFLY